MGKYVLLGLSVKYVYQSSGGMKKGTEIIKICITCLKYPFPLRNSEECTWYAVREHLIKINYRRINIIINTFKVKKKNQYASY